MGTTILLLLCAGLTVCKAQYYYYDDETTSNPTSNPTDKPTVTANNDYNYYDDETTTQMPTMTANDFYDDPDPNEAPSGTNAVGIKYEVCKRMTLKTACPSTGVGNCVTVRYDGCPFTKTCDEIESSSYEGIGGNGLLLTDFDKRTKFGLTLSPYDDTMNCVTEQETWQNPPKFDVLEKGVVYQYKYDHNDDDKCGCYEASPSTNFCYDCVLYVCSMDQPLVCTEDPSVATRNQLVGYSFVPFFMLLFIL